TWTVGAIKRRAEVLEELGPIVDNAGTNVVERVDRKTSGVCRGSEHDRWNSADQHGFGHALGAVTANVASYFAATGGVADVNGVFQVEFLDELRQVGGIGVHVIAFPRLAGAPVTAAVVGDAAVAAFGQEEHLVFPCVGAQRPSVAEDHGLSLAPVFVID